jgi:alpha-tubulin suppressor-like RCC1 family protein
MLGQSATFTLNLTNGTVLYAFQWQQNGTNIPGATNSSYTVAAVEFSDAGTYTCVVDWLGGTASNSVTLTVSALGRPALLGRPSGGVVSIGQSITLTVAAATNTFGVPLTYQWLKDGVILPGQTNSSLSIGSFQFMNGGNYQVVGRNAYGMAISVPVSLSVPGAPLQAWGDNEDGQLGIGSTTQQYSPFAAASNVVAVAAGQDHSLFVTSDGTLCAMGWNYYGQLGIGSTTQQNSPVTVTTNVAAVAAGGVHSLFVTSDGTLWAMGDNYDGQLGIGNTMSQEWPVAVADNVVAVAAGCQHSLFVTSDGTLWAMGYNYYGELGTGGTSQQNYPVAVASNVVAVAAGMDHSLFVKNDGTLWAMGYNAFGQLGIGSTASQERPVAVASNVVAVAAGGIHSLFVKNDGTLWAMGQNDSGQLGIGNTTQQNSPVIVASNVVAVTAGVSHSLFVENDGSLRAMGDNTFSQLGAGGLSKQDSPVLVAGLTVASLGGIDQAQHSLVVALSAPQIIPPQILALSNKTVVLGRTVTFTVDVVSGVGPFTNQWQMNGTTIASTTNICYTIASAKFSDAGIYTVTVSGVGGSASSSATLTVVAPPLTNQAVTLGQGVTFTLNLTNASEPYTYQWQMNGTNVPGATQTNYTIAAARFTDAGVYTGIVSGTGGSASSSATLTVAPPPPSLAVTCGAQAGGHVLNLQVGGLAGSNYVLQVTTDLTPPTQWMPLQTNLADVNGACRFIITNPIAPCSFYRIVLP